jgi:hypothetical protein
LSKFFEKCRDEYTVLLIKRLTAIRRPFKWIYLETHPYLISSDGEELIAVRASEASKESEEHEIQTGKVIQYYLVRKADSCLGRASGRLQLTVAILDPARINLYIDNTPAEEPPVVEARGLTNGHHPNDRLVVYASSFDNIGSNAVFEAHNRLPQDGMYNSLLGDHAVM